MKSFVNIDGIKDSMIRNRHNYYEINSIDDKECYGHNFDEMLPEEAADLLEQDLQKFTEGTMKIRTGAAVNSQGNSLKAGPHGSGVTVYYYKIGQKQTINRQPQEVAPGMHKDYFNLMREHNNQATENALLKFKLEHEAREHARIIEEIKREHKREIEESAGISEDTIIKYL